MALASRQIAGFLFQPLGKFLFENGVLELREYRIEVMPEHLPALAAKQSTCGRVEVSDN